MRGLLYKDVLTLVKTRLLIVYLPIVFLVPLASESNMFMMLLPCLFAATLPMSLFSLDEKSHWDVYAGALPVTRAQLVHAKYIIGLCLVGGFSLIGSLSKMLIMLCAGTLAFLDTLGILAMMIAVGLFINALVMPFVFKFGMEKGSMIYYAVLGLCGVGAGLFYGFNGLDYTSGHRISPLVTFGLLAIAAAVFALSWRVSVRFYTKREL